MLKNKKYFIDQLNSSKAFQFVSKYHYSHRGFKKAILNLGIFKNDTKELVGVLQWGCSAQDKIRLDRYVKEPIDKNQYLELNRFAMADSEGENSESQAISLGIKWIKQNWKHIKLLVSYAGRKEGNYGYIYQATNWEYLGYFISPGFWICDGEEYHQLTLWYQYNKKCQDKSNFINGICSLYHDVRQYWSKQFIYIQRLDKKLTPINKKEQYPKPSTDYPIKTKEKIYKEDLNYFNKTQNIKEIPKFYYIEDELLFTKKTLKRRGQIEEKKEIYAVYNENGLLEDIYEEISDIKITGYLKEGIKKAIKENRKYKNKYFKKFKNKEDVLSNLNIEPICWIDNIPFYNRSDVVKYANVTRQAVQNSFKNNGKTIGGKKIIWNKNNT